LLLPYPPKSSNPPYGIFIGFKRFKKPFFRISIYFTIFSTNV
jgi:hypothetical protein